MCHTFVLFRTEGKAVKSEQVINEVEVTVKDVKEKSSIAKVNPSLYKQLIIEDLTSTGEII